MDKLPRVTYSNIGSDFSAVHEVMDRRIPEFERTHLGQTWRTPFANGTVGTVRSPIEKSLVVGEFPRSTRTDVEAAVRKARAAFENWSSLTVSDRLAHASKWQERIAEKKYDIALAALYEIGKSRMEALGEAEEAQDLIEYYSSEIVRHSNYQQDMRKLVARERSESILRPYGAFGVIAPFNFPVALSVNMIMGALLTGNTVVFKPSPACALSGLLLVQAIHDAGAPEGILNIVLGDKDVGDALVQSPEIDGIAFTGSRAIGLSILRSLASKDHARPLIADMGGKNPAYVTAKANIKDAAEGVARSAFGLQGQKCSACSVAYVERSVVREFSDAIASFTSELRVGDPRQRETFIGPVYNDAAADRLNRAIAAAKDRGRIVFGGTKAEGAPDGNYFAPTIVELPVPSDLTKEELFAPFVAIRPVASLDVALSEGNAVNYGLSAGLYSTDQAEIDLFLNRAEAGVLYVNRRSGATTGAWPGGQPFCGWKGSGVSGKGGLGPNYLPQFTREQSRTIFQ